VKRDDVNALIDGIAGTVLTRLSGMAARCASNDLQMRRKIDAVVYEIRKEIAEACTAMADQANEPPLEVQDRCG
jgi:hypothetical protein